MLNKRSHPYALLLVWATRLTSRAGQDGVVGDLAEQAPKAPSSVAFPQSFRSDPEVLRAIRALSTTIPFPILLAVELGFMFEQRGTKSLHLFALLMACIFNSLHVPHTKCILVAADTLPLRTRDMFLVVAVSRNLVP